MTTSTRLPFIMAICGIAILTGCGNHTTNKHRLAIQRVLDQDATVTTNATSVAQVASRMRAIDYSKCPAEFRQAYVAHIHAWELLTQVELQAQQYDANLNSDGALLESFLRGAMGDPFGKANELIVMSNQLQQNYQQAAIQIKTTFNRIEEIAVGYGAKLPAQSTQ